MDALVRDGQNLMLAVRRLTPHTTGVYDHGMDLLPSGVNHSIEESFRKLACASCRAPPRIDQAAEQHCRVTLIVERIRSWFLRGRSTSLHESRSRWIAP